MSNNVKYLAPIAECLALEIEGLVAESYSDGGTGVWSTDSYAE